MCLYLLIFAMCVSVVATQDLEPRLFWTLERFDLDQSVIYALRGDPNVWILNHTLINVSSSFEPLDTFRIGKVVGDFYEPGIVYLHEQTSGGIFKYNMDSSTVVSAYYGSTTELRDMTFNWIAQHIYFTDGNRIVIWSPQSNHNAVLLDNLNGPEGIDVDPISRFLFWTEPSLGVIHRSTLSGSNNQVVLRGLNTPKVMTVDPDTRTLFWINDGDNSVWKSDYQGQDRTSVLGARSDSFAAIDIYKDVILLADREGTDLNYYSFNGSLINGIHFTINDQSVTNALQHGLYMVTSETQPRRDDDPCAVDNGGCEHLCVPEDSGPTCLCAFGFHKTGRNCSLNVQPRFFWSMKIDDIRLSALYVLDGDPDVYFRDPSQAQVSVFTGTWNIGKIVADINARDIAYFYFQYILNSIATYDVDHGLIDDLNIDVSSDVKDMTLDWINQNIYFTEQDKISIWSYKNDHTAVLLENLNSPDGIDVDPLSRLLFWSEPELLTRSYSISRSTLSGSDGRTILRGLNIARLITVDPDTRTLFWINDGDNSIERSDYQGQDRTLVLGAGSTSYVAVDIYKRFLLLATNNGTYLHVRSFNGTLIRTPFLTNENDSTITNVQQRGLYMASPQTLPVGLNGPCADNNGGCEEICVPGACLCRDGYSPVAGACVLDFLTPTPFTTTTTRPLIGGSSGPGTEQTTSKFLILGYVLGPVVIVAVAIVVIVVCLKKKRNRNPNATPEPKPSEGYSNPAIPMSPVQNNPYSGAPGQPVMQSPPQILAQPQVFGQPNVMMQPQAQPHQFFAQPQIQMPQNVVTQPYPQVNPMPQAAQNTCEPLNRGSAVYDSIPDSEVVDSAAIQPEPPKPRPEPNP